MKFLNLALCATVVLGTGFQTTGETPNQDAEVYFVIDTAMENNLSAAITKLVAGDLTRLTSVYEDAGYTITGGAALTGKSDATCWKAIAPVTSDLATLKSMVEEGARNQNEGAQDRYTWYAIMHAARYEMSSGDDIRKVIIGVSNKLIPWGSEVVLKDLEELECAKPQPPSSQFVRSIQKARVGVLFGAHGTFPASSAEVASAAADWFKAINLTDVAVAEAYWYDEDNVAVKVRTHVDVLEKMLSPSWIATTSTTLSPQQKLKQCIQAAVDCDDD